MLVEIGQRAEQVAPGDEEVFAAMLTDVRATPLDPARPALDLLEDLLVGIEGCAQLFAEYADYGTADDDELDEDTSDDERADARGAEIRNDFLTAVREQAAANAERLV